MRLILLFVFAFLRFVTTRFQTPDFQISADAATANRKIVKQ